MVAFASEESKEIVYDFRAHSNLFLETIKPLIDSDSTLTMLFGRLNCSMTTGITGNVALEVCIPGLRYFYVDYTCIIRDLYSIRLNIDQIVSHAHIRNNRLYTV